MLMATAARVVENKDDSSEDSDAFEYIHGDRKVGNMDLMTPVKKRLVKHMRIEDAKQPKTIRQ